MIPVLSVSEMRRIDEKAIGNNLQSVFIYAQSGRCLYDEVKRLTAPTHKGNRRVLRQGEQRRRCLWSRASA